MNYKRHKIFASGVHKKADQAQAVWPADRVLGVYESSKANSPAMIPYTYRHPQNSLPVFGYAERDSLEVFEDGGRTYLSVVPKEMATEFLDGLKKAGLNQVSVGLGKKGEIVHIGFTDNPAVTGLGAAFEASEAVPPVYLEEVEFEASDLGDISDAFDVSWKWRLQSWMDDVASIFQRLRDREIELNGLDSADKFLPSYVMDYLKLPLPADVPSDGAGSSVFETNHDTPMTAEEKAKMDRLEAENARLMADAETRIDVENKARVTQFCDDLPAIITPAIRPKVESFLLSLIGSAPVSFEDEKGLAQQADAFEFACELLRTGVKPSVVFGTVAGKETAPDGGTFEAGKDPVRDALKDQYEAAGDK